MQFMRYLIVAYSYSYYKMLLYRTLYKKLLRYCIHTMLRKKLLHYLIIIYSL